MFQQLVVGSVAPNFEAVDQNNQPIELQHFKGKKIVLYFYPKDDTPGCTSQACNLRDNYVKLQKAGIVVLGVSVDDAESHKKFEKKYDLPFSLVADDNKKISKAYGVYNTIFGFSKRVTFLINEEGKIRHIIYSPKVGKHTEEILALWKQ